MLSHCYSAMLGATYRGCDLLGQLAENAGIDNQEIKGKKNDSEELQTRDHLQKSSLRRSLSLSELITSMAIRDNDISANQVANCTANVTQHMSSVFCEEQCAVDADGHQEQGLHVSNDDCSFTDIPPLSQRLQMNYFHFDLTVTDSVSVGGLVADEQPMSGTVAESGGEDMKSHCLKVSGTVADSGREDTKSHCLKQSFQPTVKSDPVPLRSRRRHALKLLAASILSDDVFFDVAKPPDTKIEQQKASHSDSAEGDKIIAEDDNGIGSNDTDVCQVNRLDSKHKESVKESDIIQKFESSLHKMDKSEHLESASRNKCCISEQLQVTKTLHELDHYVEIDAVALSSSKLIGKSTINNSQQCAGPVVWSPRHCGNFCIDTSVVNTPSDSCENALLVHELSLCDEDNVNSGSRTSFGKVSTGSEESANSAEVSSNVDAKSELLFDDPVSPDDKLVLPLVSESSYKISVTERGCDQYSENDYSVIIID